MTHISELNYKSGNKISHLKGTYKLTLKYSEDNKSINFNTSFSLTSELNYSNVNKSRHFNDSFSNGIDARRSELNRSYYRYGNTVGYHNDAFDDILYTINITDMVISISGIVLNMLVIIALLSLKGSLKTHLKLVLSLAISDFIIAFEQCGLTVFDFPFGWKYITDGFRQSAGITNITYAVLLVMAQYAGLGTMLTISVDILIKIRMPLKYKRLMSKRRGNIIVICLWFVLPLMFLVISWILTTFVISNQSDVLVPFIGASLLYFMLCIVFFIVFVILYIVIACSIKTFTNRSPSGRRKSVKKAFVTFLVIIATYCICLMPLLWIIITLHVLKSKVSLLLVRSIYCLYTVNTICDPIIYIFRIPELKMQYRILYQKLCHTGHNEATVCNVA